MIDTWVVFEAIVWTVGLGTITLCFFVCARGAKGLIVEVFETLLGIVLGTLTYDPSRAKLDSKWTVDELKRLKQGLILLHMLEEEADDDDEQ